MVSATFTKKEGQIVTKILCRSLRNEIFVGVFASRDISKDEELFYDYNFATFGGGQDQTCYCGSPQCRGTMGRKSRRDRT